MDKPPPCGCLKPECPECSVRHRDYLDRLERLRKAGHPFTRC